MKSDRLLNVSLADDQVKVFALQVYEPSDYQDPTTDADKLGTLFISYIPTDTVTSLEQSIKAKQSLLYTGVEGISKDLASRIDASYSVTSINNPLSSSDSSSSSGGSDARRDAIIGVCSALAGIAVCILAFLIYRHYKRRQESAHRRINEPPVMAGVPEPGHEFDRDSVGGQRRRSFYYAEDSLRGYAQSSVVDDMYDHRYNTTAATAAATAGMSGGMRERRPIAPGAISAPILRDNTMNW